MQNEQTKRMLIAIGLSLALFTAYTTLFPQASVDEKAAAQADAGTELAAAAPLSLDAGAAASPTALAAAPNEPGSPTETPEKKTELPERQVKVDRATTQLVFSSEGASIASATLLGKKEHEQQHVSIAEGWQHLFGKKRDAPKPMNMAVPVPGLPNPYAVSIAGAQPLLANLRYEVLEQSAGSLTFRGTQGPWEVVKRYRWADDGYGMALSVSVKNVSAAPVGGELGVHSARSIDPANEEQASLFGGIGNAASVTCRTADDVNKLIPHGEPGLFSCGSAPKPTADHKGPLHFIGIDQQYFLSALYPLKGAPDARCVLTATPVVRSVEAFYPLTVQPNETVTFDFGLFLGPKELDLLGAAPSAAATLVGLPADAAATVGTSVGLEKTVDFGWWAFICKVLLVVLKFFHSLIGNWGVAIILLTLSVKVILLPLTHKAMVSAESMKKLQPQLEAIKKKYPDDRERQNAETMKMYQEAKVNPLGGCLPLLVQLPIWAALFTTLRTSYDLYGEPFFGPVWTDLTFKDPTYLLPFALGVTMIITQKLQPQMMDPAQARIMTWVMPVFFTAIMMNYPAGLALYIFTNNLLSIAQQFALRKYLEKKGVATPRAKGLKESRS